MTGARGNRTVVLAALAGLLATPSAWPDADEAWLHRAELPPGVAPLLVLLIDSSASASRLIAAPPGYDPATDYSARVPAEARCESSRVYWRRGPGSAPDCATQPGLVLAGDGEDSGFHCEAARASLARSGFFIASRAAQWQAAGRWTRLESGAEGAVECRADRGRHGAARGNWYAADDGRRPWSEDSSQEIRWDRPPLADPYLFYLGNYLNYLLASLPSRDVAAGELFRTSLAEALEATDSLEAALLGFPARADAEGGYVASAAVPAAQVAARIGSFTHTTAEAAPLAGLVTEAAAWLAGSSVRFGEEDAADSAAFGHSRAIYRSPFTHACRPVSIALVAAGAASGDVAAEDAAAALPGFSELTGGCAGDCLAALAQYLTQADLLDGLAGNQSAQYLRLGPERGPGIAAITDPQAYLALVARAHQHDAAVPAGPSLSAAGTIALTPTLHAPAVIHALTAPQARERWIGNAFRYGLRAPDSPLNPPRVVDRDGEIVLDEVTGLPRPATRSEWSDAQDANLLAGGAVGRLPAAGVRRIYSDIASTDLTDPRNRLSPDHANIDRAAVGLGAADPQSPADVIDWLLASRPLGDPGLRAPLVVNYRADGSAIAFVATQDGMLHALDAGSGVERWAFLPRELMPRLAALKRDEPTTARSHGMDGVLVAHRFDPNGDGIIDTRAGEHLWLVFGLGRGGGSYRALDIADPDAPRLLWTLVPAGSEAAEIRSEPVIARLATGETTQSSHGWVVLLAAGAALHVFDASSGNQLWSAGAGSGFTLPLPELLPALPSAPRALDMNGDGQVDRAYLLDAAGGLWRFDFTPGAGTSALASARRIARLGDGSQRFRSSPDISIARLHGRNQVAIAAGSGRIDRPRDAGVIDRVAVVYDRDDGRVVTEQDLHDATERDAVMPATASGWFFRLDRHGAGEKVIGPPVTFNHVLRFQTYQPLAPSEEQPCGPPAAMRRLYARDIRTGLPSHRVHWPQDEEDMELVAPGLPSELRFVFPPPAHAACTDCRPRAFGTVGARTFDAGYAGDPVKTSWRKLPNPPDSR